MWDISVVSSNIIEYNLLTEICFNILFEIIFPQISINSFSVVLEI